MSDGKKKIKKKERREKGRKHIWAVLVDATGGRRRRRV